MRILIDARMYGLENSGIGRYTMNLVFNLCKLDKLNNYIILLRRKYFRELDLPKNWEKIEADFKHYSLVEQIKLPKIIYKQKVDLVHFLHFNVPYFFRGKFVVTIHDLIMHKSKGRLSTTLPIYLYGLKRMGYRVIFKKAIHESTKIVVPSVYVKKDIAKYYGIDKNKLVVIYEGVSKFQASRESADLVLRRYHLDTDFFIYTGNVYPHKNLKRAIEAIVLLNKNRDRKVKFVIVSARNVFVENLLKIVEEEGANDYVDFLGFIPDSDLTRIYQNSLGFVSPSLYEGFGLPGLEAIKAGTIALVSDIPVFREIYGSNAIFFDPFDFTSIENAMREAIAMKPKKREAFLKKSQKFIEKYSWQEMAKQILKVYSDCK